MTKKKKSIRNATEDKDNHVRMAHRVGNIKMICVNDKILCVPNEKIIIKTEIY